MSRVISFLVLSTVILVLAGAWVFTGVGGNGATPDAGTAAASSATSGPADQQDDRTEHIPDFVEALARELKAEFGPRIDEITIQARFYEIRKDVIERFPEKGREYFRQALQLAFPENAEAILSLIARLETYNDWLMTENRTLMELSPIERSGMLWEKRREIFGDQADMLWADERAVASDKRQQVQKTLERLGQADNMSIDETLYQLRNELDETFDGPMRQLIEDSGAVSGAFFTLESVQKKLGSLPAAERQARIDAVRRQLGFSDEAVERMRERDQERERRWDRGKAYMEKREQVMGQYQDEAARKRALEALRSEYFDHEAATIRREEEVGFFRYERPRVYGRN